MAEIHLQRWCTFKRRSIQKRLIVGLVICVHLIAVYQAIPTLPQQESSFEEIHFTRLEDQLRSDEDDLPFSNGINTSNILKEAEELRDLFQTKADNMEIDKSAVLLKKFRPKKRHRDHKHLLANSMSVARCTIDITNKIAGICQLMGTFGNACVSGDYVDIFNESCQ